MAQPFYSQDFLPEYLAELHDARPNRLPIDQHRAGPALALPTAYLGSCQAEVLPQHEQ